MPFEILWLVNQKVIDMHLSGEINETYMLHASNQLHTYLRQVDDKMTVHLIFSASQDVSLQMSVNELFNMLRFLMDSTVEYLIRVGPAPATAMYTARLLARSLRLKYQQFDTVEDALIFLEAADEAKRSLV